MIVKPFRAFRFNEKVVGDVAACIAPPYDVISPDQQQKLCQQSEYNIVHITKGLTTPADTDADNQYTRAAVYFKTWMEKTVLTQDAAEAVYPYIQDFKLAGKYYQRLSFIASAKLEEFGKKVRPHERTLDGPRIDRLRLKRATAASFGLVFMLYQDSRQVADKIIENAARQKPLIDFTDHQHVRHRLFAVTAAADIQAVARMMRDKTCIIADGHHRYETALAYYQEPKNPAASCEMMAFVNVLQNGLVILATHRLVGNLPNLDCRKLLSELAESFELVTYAFDSPATRTDARLKTFARMRADHADDRNAFGIYAGSNAFYAAVLKNGQAMNEAAPGMSDVSRSLDVSVLHKLIIEKRLGIGEKQLAAGGCIEYITDTDSAIDEAIEKVDRGQKQLVFFLNPAKMQQIQMVTAAGERMPQKSTYFYPKMYAGLTVYKI